MSKNLLTSLSLVGVLSLGACAVQKEQLAVNTNDDSAEEKICKFVAALGVGTHRKKRLCFSQAQWDVRKEERLNDKKFKRHLRRGVIGADPTIIPGR